MLEVAHKLCLAAADYQVLSEARNQLLTLLGKQHRRCHMLTQKRFYKQGNKSGRLLASALRQCVADYLRDQRFIRSGWLQRSTQDIASQFQTFYQSLFNLTRPSEQSTKRGAFLRDFLTTYCPPPITDKLASYLESLLTSEELLLALKQIKPGKSPSPDGFTTQYYKIFSDALLPYFLQAFNSAITQTPHSLQLLEAHITVLPKGDKDRCLVMNYRPITLLNVDVKWYAKALANRMLTLLLSIISLDQLGFVPGREAWDNTLKPFFLHHWMTEANTPGFFLSMDAENASIGGLGKYVCDPLTSRHRGTIPVEAQTALFVCSS